MGSLLSYLGWLCPKREGADINLRKQRQGLASTIEPCLAAKLQSFHRRAADSSHASAAPTIRRLQHPALALRCRARSPRPPWDINYPARDIHAGRATGRSGPELTRQGGARACSISPELPSTAQPPRTTARPPSLHGMLTC